MSTFAEYLAGEGGAVAFRLVIEGCRYIFVTDDAMECEMDDGRIVVRGLDPEGLQIDEEALPALCELTLRLSSVSINETDGPNADAATRAFTSYTAQSMLTTLAEGVDLGFSASVAQVRSTAVLNVGDVVHAGTEAWRITSITPSGTIGPSTIGIERGVWDTIQQGFRTTVHSISGPQQNFVPIHKDVPQYAGRRVWLYGHGSDELALDPGDSTVDGTLLWRGILQSNPEESEPNKWALSLEPRIALLDAEVGAGTGDNGGKLRGIYYSGYSPLEIQFVLRNGAQYDDLISARINFRLHGFYETQEAFCSALSDALNASIGAAWGGSWTATVGRTLGGGEQWELYYTGDLVSPRWVDVVGYTSLIDGSFNSTMLVDIEESGHDTILVSTIAAGRTYRAGWDTDRSVVASRRIAQPPADQLRRVPRACYARTAMLPVALSDVAAYPAERFYLTDVAPYLVSGTVRVTPPGDSGDAAPDDFAIASSGPEGYIAPTGVDYAVIGNFFVAVGTWQPTFAIGVNYGGVLGCNLAQFMSAVLLAANDGGNSGSPFVTSEDVADWTDVVEAAIGGDAGLARRVYTFVKPRKLIDVVREECKLLGLYLVVDVDGRIAVRPLPEIGASLPTLSIDDDTVTPGDDWGTMKLSPNGIITSVEVKGGYDPNDDKWQTSWTFHALGGTPQTKSKGQPLTIAPFVREYGSAPSTGDMPIATAARRVLRVMQVFGVQYATIDVPVSMEAHGVAIGDTVLATIPQIPFAGARGSTTPGSGLSNTRCFVIGRKFMYGDSPGGTLTLLAIAVNGAGYAPGCKITSASGAGLSWTLTAAHAEYGPGTVADASFFATGYRIVLAEHDSDSPVRILGTVTSVVGDTIAVTLDSAWSGIGAAPWYELGFAASNEGIVEAQKAFCYWAEPTGRIVYNDGTSDNARVFQ